MMFAPQIAVANGMSGGGAPTAARSLLANAALDLLECHLAIIDDSGRIIATNATWDRFAGENGADPSTVGVGSDYLAVTAAAVVDDPFASEVLTGLRTVLAGACDTFSIEYPCHSPWERRWFRLTATRSHGPGHPHVIIVHVPVTGEKAAADEARIRGEVVDSLDAAVVALDLDGVVTEWSLGATRLYGFSPADAVGRSVRDLIAPLHRVPDRGRTLQALMEDGAWEGELNLLHRDGTTVPVHVRSRLVHDDAGEQTGMITVSVDLRARLELEQHLAQSNRWLRAITERMGEGLCTLDAQGRITYVNPVGEELLHASDGGAEGGSFVNRLLGHHPDGTPRGLNERLIGADFDGVVPGEVTPDRLLRPDGSLLDIEYVATPLPEDHNGSSNGWVVVFRDISARLEEEAQLREQAEDARWLARITDALENDRFVLFAQPIVDIATGETVQHELLIRLHDPEEGIVAPGRFLPVAEEYGLILSIDRWVIAQAIAMAADGNNVELNLSARSLSDPSLPHYVGQLLAASGADPARIAMEVTETALVGNEEAARHFAEQVRSLGCQLALDDFGTGYGAFTYLKHLPVDALKIDIEFVRDVTRDEASRHVISAVVALAKAFGLTTVAEGVEDEETLQVLRGLGVDQAQGYHLGRPAPAAGVFAASRADERERTR